MEVMDTKDVMSIMKYGTAVQEEFAGLSECAFLYLRNSEIKNINDRFLDMLSFFNAYDSNKENTYEICERADAMKDELGQLYIRILMECEAINQFHVMNKICSDKLDACIHNARQVLPEIEKESGSDVRLRFSTLEKRINELVLTRNISESFNAQMDVILGNANVIANKIQSTFINALSMWKSRLLIEMQTGENFAQKSEEVVSQLNEFLKLTKQVVNLIAGNE